MAVEAEPYLTLGDCNSPAARHSLSKADTQTAGQNTNSGPFGLESLRSRCFSQQSLGVLGAQLFRTERTVVAAAEAVRLACVWAVVVLRHTSWDTQKSWATECGLCCTLTGDYYTSEAVAVFQYFPENQT